MPYGLVHAKFTGSHRALGQACPLRPTPAIRKPAGITSGADLLLGGLINERLAA
ncbi:MAG: hypothetical protein ABI775_12415 [Pseudonocardiales bacterium]